MAQDTISPSSLTQNLLRLPQGLRLVLFWGTRLTLAGVFLWAAIPKLADPQTFATDISNYHMLPESLVPLMAVFVPVLELITAIAILLGVWTEGALVVLSGMLVAFTAGLIQALVRGIELDCGCFGGTTESSVSWLSVGRNVGLLLCAGIAGLLCLTEAHNPWSPRGPSQGGPGPSGPDSSGPDPSGPDPSGPGGGGSSAASAASAGLILLGSLVHAPQANASTVLAMSAAELYDAADVVAVVRVESHSMMPARGSVHTRYALRVVESYKGTEKSAQLFYRKLGGVDGTIVVNVSGEPSLFEQREYLLFARHWEKAGGDLRPVGLSQGVLPLRFDKDAPEVCPGNRGARTVSKLPSGKVTGADPAVTRCESLSSLIARAKSVKGARPAPGARALHRAGPSRNTGR